jgi:hypothetical protein
MVRPSVALRIPQLQYLLQEYGAGAFGPREVPGTPLPRGWVNKLRDAVLRALSGLPPVAHVVPGGVVVSAIQLAFLGAVKVHGDRRLAARVPNPVDALVVRELKETRETAERELTALRGRRERLEELERDKEVLLDSYAGLTPEALDSLAPEERHWVYGMLGVRAVAHVGGTLEVGEALAGPISVSKGETARSWGFSTPACGGRG